MSVDCSHGSFSEYPRIAEHGDCPDCRMARIESLLERMLDALGDSLEVEARAAALEAWRNGQGRHPDD